MFSWKISYLSVRFDLRLPITNGTTDNYAADDEDGDGDGSDDDDSVCECYSRRIGIVQAAWETGC